MKDPWHIPHSPKKPWIERIRERVPLLEAARQWRRDAMADGWTSEPTYRAQETDETHARLWRDGFVAHVMARPGGPSTHGGPFLPMYGVHVWGPDGMAIRVGLVYDDEAIRRGPETCIYCGVHPVKTERVGFAGRACPTCRPIEWAKLPKNWAD